MKQASSPFSAVLKLLLKWWWLIALSVALGAGIGHMVRIQQPNIYVAKTRILFGQSFASGTTASVANMTQLRELISVYIGLVRLPTILEPVIEDLGLGINVDRLNEMMSIERSERLPLLEISIADTRPDRAANIANRIAQELIRQSPTEQVSQETMFKREQLAGIQRQIEELQSEYDGKIAAGSVMTSALEIAQNLQERSFILENLQKLRALYAEMSAGLGDQRLLRVFDYADPGTASIITGTSSSVILAGVAGLLLSIATIVLINYFDDRLTWNEGIDSILGAKVLGPLGVVPRSKLPLYLITMPEAIESEVLRQLRAKLVLTGGGVPPRTLTVTSYDSGDGKTVTAANLALAFAQSGLQTLLVDGDIRKGDLHEIFRLPNVMGISDVLASREDIPALLSQALLDSGYDRLAVLTSGRSSVDPAALLSGPRFAQLISLLKSQFDVVVMDSVPTIGGPDSAFMAEQSDGVLVVVDSRRTTSKALKRTLQMLGQARQINLYGLVFNRVYLQVSTTHNQPYYRRTISLNPERLSRELSDANKRKFGFNRHIITDRQGERLYSLKATAIQLGISEDTVNNWIKVGYITTTRRGRRRWVKESEIQSLLDRLPRRQLPLIGANGDSHKDSDDTPLPHLLRDQRNALLDYVREPHTQPEPEADSAEDETDEPRS